MMLYQIHHLFEDGHTEMLIQRETNDKEDYRSPVEEAINKHPCREDAQYLICNEESEYFLYSVGTRTVFKEMDELSRRAIGERILYEMEKIEE